jgi:soluble lytic murein transglycosylase-like protein
MEETSARQDRHWSQPLVRLLLALAAVIVAAGLAERASAGASYRVQPGDTLTAIAARHDTSIAVLARLNKLDPAQVLQAGVSLKLPQPRARRQLMSYVVRPGDTLSQIALDRGLTLREVARLNRLDPADVLPAGRRLLLPASPTKSTIRASLVRWADHHRIPRSLALALAWQESGHQPEVVSDAGAVGVMQVMPDTWTYVETILIGRPIRRTADGNVRVGLTYLRHLLNTFGNTQLALAAYYQGERSVRTEGIYGSTRPYIANILALEQRVRDGVALS